MALAACAPHRSFPDDGRLHVAAAFFPLAEAAREVGGDDVTVADLTPPGVEPHDLELTTRQMDKVEDATVVLLLGGGFQPALADAAKRARGRVIVLGAPRFDPHVWLDPVRMKSMVAQVAETLAAVRPAAAPAFQRRALAYQARLDRLHDRYTSGLAQCRRRTLVTAHAAFGWLAAQYGLTQQAVTGLSPEAEPDPRRLARLADTVRRTGTTTVFTESLVSPKVATALAREAGVRTDVLDPLESGHPGGYVPVMQANLDRLRHALDCP